MKKRILALLMAAAMMFALAACGQPEQPTPLIPHLTTARLSSR